ncbi:MAG: YARHG domain-containing protein [Rhodomicrobium sp.]
MTMSRSLKVSLLLLSLFAWAAALPQAAAQDDSATGDDSLSGAAPGSCGDLWFRRNAIYFRNGYCFKTGRGIRQFGNENCRFTVEADVPMSRAERQEVLRIREMEREQGCRS